MHPQNGQRPISVFHVGDDPSTGVRRLGADTGGQRRSQCVQWRRYGDSDGDGPRQRLDFPVECRRSLELYRQCGLYRQVIVPNGPTFNIYVAPNGAEMATIATDPGNYVSSIDVMVAPK